MPIKQYGDFTITMPDSVEPTGASPSRPRAIKYGDFTIRMPELIREASEAESTAEAFKEHTKAELGVTTGTMPAMTQKPTQKRMPAETEPTTPASVEELLDRKLSEKLSPQPSIAESTRVATPVATPRTTRKEDVPIQTTMPTGGRAGTALEPGAITQQPALGALDALKELKSEPERLVPFIRSVPVAKELADVASAAYRLESGTSDDPDYDYKTIERFRLKNSKDTTFMYDVINIVSQTPAFGLELAATGGLYTGGKQAAASVGKSALTKILGESAEQFAKRKSVALAGKVATGIAGATLQAPIAGVGSIATGTAERMLPDFETVRGKDGKVTHVQTSGGKKLIPALAEANANNWVEVTSEYSGNVLKPLFKMLPEKVINSAIANALKKANPMAKSETFRKLAESTRFNGTWGEMFEERMGEIGRAVLGLEEYRLPSPKQLATELVAFSVPGLAGHLLPKTPPTEPPSGETPIAGQPVPPTATAQEEVPPAEPAAAPVPEPPIPPVAEPEPPAPPVIPPTIQPEAPVVPQERISPVEATPIATKEETGGLIAKETPAKPQIPISTETGVLLRAGEQQPPSLNTRGLKQPAIDKVHKTVNSFATLDEALAKYSKNTPVHEYAREYAQSIFGGEVAPKKTGTVRIGTLKSKSGTYHIEKDIDTGKWWKVKARGKGERIQYTPEAWEAHLKRVAGSKKAMETRYSGMKFIPEDQLGLALGILSDIGVYKRTGIGNDTRLDSTLAALWDGIRIGDPNKPLQSRSPLDFISKEEKRLRDKAKNKTWEPQDERGIVRDEDDLILSRYNALARGSGLTEAQDFDDIIELAKDELRDIYRVGTSKEARELEEQRKRNYGLTYEELQEREAEYIAEQERLKKEGIDEREIDEAQRTGETEGLRGADADFADEIRRTEGGEVDESIIDDTFNFGANVTQETQTPVDYGSLSDAELKERRDALPKYKNDMTPEQIADGDAIYAEQNKRFKATVDKYNTDAMEKTGLKHGDEVTYTAQGFGMPETYRGKVVYDKNGYLSVKTNIPDGSGRKIHGINIGWKKVTAPAETKPPVAKTTELPTSDTVVLDQRKRPIRLSRSLVDVTDVRGNVVPAGEDVYLTTDTAEVQYVSPKLYRELKGATGTEIFAEGEVKTVKPEPRPAARTTQPQTSPIQSEIDRVVSGLKKGDWVKLSNGVTYHVFADHRSVGVTKIKGSGATREETNIDTDAAGRKLKTVDDALSAARDDALAEITAMAEGKDQGVLFEPEPSAPTETQDMFTAPAPTDVVETDPAKRQELMNSIAEGEMILKSGKTSSGRTMDADELTAVQRAVDNTMKKLGEQPTTTTKLPWDNATAEDENRWYGTKVNVAQGKSKTSTPYIGTVERVLNNGAIVEVKPDDMDTTFRVESDRITVKPVGAVQPTIAPVEQRAQEPVTSQMPTLSRQSAQALLDLPWTDQIFPMGPSRVKFRQRILSELTGQKVPSSKAGANAVREALFKAAGVDKTGKALFEQEDEARAWLKKVAEGKDNISKEGGEQYSVRQGDKPYTQPLFRAGSTTPAAAGMTLKDVKSMFPNADRVGQDSAGNFWVAQNGHRLKIESVSHITPNSASFSVGYKREQRPGEVIAGSYRKGTIRVSREAGDRWTIAHEDFHWLRDIGVITTADINALDTVIAKRTDKAKDKITDEDRANFVESERKKRTEDREKGTTRRIIQKILDFLDALANMVKRTARGVIRDIESKKVLKRTAAVATTGDEQYSAKEPPESGGKKPPSGYGDVGGYATIPPEGKTPPPFDGEPEASKDEHIAMELPEIVDLAQQLMDGKYPQIVRKIRGMAIGTFSPETGTIRVEAGLFKTLDDAIRTVARELGHIADWLPDKELKRGNILGRIASLRNYTKHWLENRPGSPGPLTEEDRKRLRKEARILARKDSEKWVDEVIRKTMPITPDDVLNIWRSATADIRDTNPELYNYIARLSSAEKKFIVKEAMWGAVPENLKKFGRVVEEKTGRKIQVEPSEKEIYDRYKQLVLNEIQKRSLWNRDAIQRELERFTTKWKPFDVGASPDYTKYRFSSKELYADAFSALMVNPKYLEDNAPLFYEAYFNWQESKPEVQRIYNEIQDEIRNGKTVDTTLKRIYAGFDRREEEYKDVLKRSFTSMFTLDAWMRGIIDRYYAIESKVNKTDNVPDDINPVFKIEDWVYSGAEGDGYIHDFYNTVYEPMKRAGISVRDFGAFLFSSRIASGDRTDIANPYGVTPERAAAIQKILNDRYGDSLPSLQDAFRVVRNAWIIDKIAESKTYSPDLIKFMQDNVNYVTFDIVGHLNSHYGARATSHIYRQLGTFNPAGEPMTATVLKDLLIIRSVNRNVAVRSVVEFMEKYYPEEVLEPKRKWTGNHWDYQDSGDPQYGLVLYLKDGDVVGKYIPSGMAQSLEHNSIEDAIFVRALAHFTGYLKELFTGVRPGFFAFNIIRDYMSAVKNLKGLSVTKYAPYFARAIRPAFGSFFKSPNKEVLYMLRHGMLISAYDFHGGSTEDIELERTLKRFSIDRKTWRKHVENPFRALYLLLTNTGKSLDRVNKIAGFSYLRDAFPDMSTERIAHIVRSRPGSPDFLRRGTGTPILNSLLLYSNPMKEGWRSSYESAKEDKKGYAWKTIKYTIIPKLAMMAAEMGLVGWALKAIMDRIPEYDKANYSVIPLGITPTGKAVYFRMPQDETGRFIGGLFWKAFEKDRGKYFSNLFDYMSGQAPTLNPLISGVVATAQYMSGQNPYDWFRGRSVVDEQVFSAGGMRSHKEFAKWLSNHWGMGILYTFKSDDRGSIKTELENVIGLPLVNDTLGRFIKVSDQGIRQDIAEESRKLNSLNNQTILTARDGLQKIFEGKEPTLREREALAERANDIPYHWNKMLAYRFGNVYVQKLLTARSKDEKLIIINKMLSDPTTITENNAITMWWDMMKKSKIKIDEDKQYIAPAEPEREPVPPLPPTFYKKKLR